MDSDIVFPRSKYLYDLTLTLTGGSSPAARTNRLTFRYPLTPAERSSGSQSSSHFLKKQCPKNNCYDLESSRLAPSWSPHSLTHCAHCRWYRHPTVTQKQTRNPKENTVYAQVLTFLTGCRKAKDRSLPWIHRLRHRSWVIGSHRPVGRLMVTDSEHGTLIFIQCTEQQGYAGYHKENQSYSDEDRLIKQVGWRLEEVQEKGLLKRED